MTSCVVILSVFDPMGLRVACGIGCCVGIAALFCGLRFERRARISRKESQPSPSDASPIAPFIESKAPQEIIRLSTEPVAAKSFEMSQQQKIAAALARSGMAESGVWRSPASSRESAVAIEDLPEAPDSPIISPAMTTLVASQSSSSRPRSSTLTRKLILLAGSILILISLFVLLTLR